MISQDGDTVTIRGAALLGVTYRAVLLGIRARRHDGLPSADLQQLARALRWAHDMSRERHELVDPVRNQPGWNGQNSRDLNSVADAAGLLRLSRRQVQRLAANPGGLNGVRVGRTWALPKAPVLALACERKVAP